VTVTVDAVDDAPVCAPVSVSTDADTPVEVAPACSDVDSDSLRYSIVDQPAHGTAGVVAGRLLYTPAGGASGTDSFSYRASDGRLDSTAATATITVTGRAAPSRCDARADAVAVGVRPGRQPCAVSQVVRADPRLHGAAGQRPARARPAAARPPPGPAPVPLPSGWG
jgi:hypothetical protein